MASNTLNSELIEFFKKCLAEAEPYTEEEMLNIPADSTDYDPKKRSAYMAQKVLREAGLLNEE